jgi:hypothetical protein
MFYKSSLIIIANINKLYRAIIRPLSIFAHFNAKTLDYRVDNQAFWRFSTPSVFCTIFHFPQKTLLPLQLPYQPIFIKFQRF